MYGHYQYVIDLSDTIGEVSLLLAKIKGRRFPLEDAVQACAHYKQLALVCACAFMMSPVGSELRKDNFSPTRIRNMLMGEIQRVYPMFATERDEWWGYDSVMAVVTELATSLLNDLVISTPKLKQCIGIPSMYIFVPSHVEDSPTGMTLTFVLHCRPPLGAKLLSAN